MSTTVDSHVEPKVSAPDAAATNKRPPMTKSQKRTLLIFLGPAAVLLIVMVIYPAFYSVIRSLWDDDGNFVGLQNYIDMFSASSTQQAIQNNLIWVLAAPLITTTLGLIFAVLMDKIKWKTAFRLIIFMPMAISMLAAGIIFRSIFQQNPEIGTANAIIVGVQEFFGDSTQYPGARARDPETLVTASDGALDSTETYSAGDVVGLPLVGVKPDAIPEDAPNAALAESGSDQIVGTVWLDFARGGGGQEGVIDDGEAGLSGMEVQLVDSSGSVVDTVVTDDRGQFVFESVSGSGYSISLPATNFAESPKGIDWLGPSLITPVMIVAFIWIWAGFAMVMIGAGLSAVDRSLMEAARVDGANEWQVFRHVTVPQLLPTITVVLVTLTINVLKIFDLVYVIPPGQSKEAGTVVAVEMWKHFGNYSYGIGSALAVLLVIMVLPFMLWQVRNFRKGN